MSKLFDFHHHHEHLKDSTDGIYNLGLEESAPDGYFSAGIHPQDINKLNARSWENLETLAAHQNCLAIGECGLDGLIKIRDEQQEQLFLKQLHLANRLNKPLIIHCVRRYSALISLAKDAIVPLIVHGYHKKSSVAKELLAQGFYLSFGSAVLRNVSLQAVVAETPLNRLFLETDDSHFSLDEIYAKVAELKNLSLIKLQAQISENLESIIHGK